MFTTFNKFQPKLTSVSKCCQMLTIGLFLDQKDFGPIFFVKNNKNNNNNHNFDGF